MKWKIECKRKLPTIKRKRHVRQPSNDVGEDFEKCVEYKTSAPFDLIRLIKYFLHSTTTMMITTVSSGAGPDWAAICTDQDQTMFPLSTPASDHVNLNGPVLDRSEAHLIFHIYFGSWFYFL